MFKYFVFPKHNVQTLTRRKRNQIFNYIYLITMIYCSIVIACPLLAISFYSPETERSFFL